MHIETKCKMGNTHTEKYMTGNARMYKEHMMGNAHYETYIYIYIYMYRWKSIEKDLNDLKIYVYDTDENRINMCGIKYVYKHTHTHTHTHKCYILACVSLPDISRGDVLYDIYIYKVCEMSLNAQRKGDKVCKKSTTHQKISFGNHSFFEPYL